MVGVEVVTWTSAFAVELADGLFVLSAPSLASGCLRLKLVGLNRG